jgi:hypothetical protein
MNQSAISFLVARVNIKQKFYYWKNKNFKTEQQC